MKINRHLSLHAGHKLTFIIAQQPHIYHHRVSPNPPYFLSSYRAFDVADISFKAASMVLDEIKATGLKIFLFLERIYSSLCHSLSFL